MQTTNFCFTTMPQLEQVIEQHSYVNNKNLMIQIFSADIQDANLSSIVKYLANKLPQAVIIGASTDGEILDGKAISNSTVLSFTTFEHTQVKAQIYSLSGAQFKIGQQIAQELGQEDTKAIIILADGLSVNGDDLLDGIYDINQQVVIAGGLAGDYRCMQKTLVIYQGQIQKNAVVACALNGKDLIVNTKNIFGWQPIGKSMLVTKAVANQLYELDDQPVRSIYAKYLGEDVATELPVSAGEYPLLIKRYGKYIARAALQLLSDGSMQYAGNFKVGDRVQFGYGHIPFILTSAKSTIESMYSLPIETIFIYSCSARKYFMGDEVDKELLPLEFLTNTVGFFTYGEFFHAGKKNELLNESMTLLMLSENPAAIKAEATCLLSTNETVEKHNFEKLFHLIDVTGNELNDLNEKLESMVADKTKEVFEKVYIDTLTKLPNRSRLLEDFSAKSTFNPAMVALIDIDDFKQINDYYGYKVGDQLLLTLAQELNTVLFEYLNLKKIKLYKLPIDEFAIVANNSISIKDFTGLIDRVVDPIFAADIIAGESKFFLNHTSGMSLGRAESNDYLDQIDGVLLQANMALREAKDTRVRKVIYHTDMHLKQELAHNISWTKKIKQAIDQDKFIPYFQPIIASATGKIEKYECLIRMQEEDGKISSPYAFLDIARKAKLYPYLTRIMIDKCFAVFAKNGKHFSLNLSIADTHDAKTMDYIFEKLQTGNIGRQLTFEILESEDIDSYVDLANLIVKLKKFGCKIAIDDFGSGYSNFKHIIEMDIDYLKIDGSLIKNIAIDQEVQLMVEMILTLCKKINIKTVAEFVSDEVIYKMVKQLGVDYLQGYYLGEPSPICD